MGELPKELCATIAEELHTHELAEECLGALAVLIVIAGFTVGLLSIRRPKDIEVKINNRGIKAGTEFHSWSGLESFWLEEETDPPKIILISKRFLLPHIIIPLGDVNFGDVHDVLLEHLPQVEHHESIVDVLAARLGF